MVKSTWQKKFKTSASRGPKVRHHRVILLGLKVTASPKGSLWPTLDSFIVLAKLSKETTLTIQKSSLSLVRYRTKTQLTASMSSNLEKLSRPILDITSRRKSSCTKAGN